MTPPPANIPADPAHNDHYRGFFEISTSLAPLYSNSQFWFFETGNQYVVDERRHGFNQVPPFYYRDSRLVPCYQNDNAYGGGVKPVEEEGNEDVCIW